MTVQTACRSPLIMALAVMGCSPGQPRGAVKNDESLRVSLAAQAPKDDQAHSYPPEYITDPTAVKAARDRFDDQLKSFGQRVQSCEHVVRIQIGKDSPVYGQGLAAYGAYCMLAKGQSVVMCYEEASGRFVIASGSFTIARPWITAFTSRNCAD